MTFLDGWAEPGYDNCHPLHRMTRRECCEYRNQCFEYLWAEQILPSSEEASGWSVKSLVFCHYAPYGFMLRRPGNPRKGIPVPLLNLVYHDCTIEPWMMDRLGGEDYMLYALLNKGAPYLIREGAYPNTDGAFGEQRAQEPMATKRELTKTFLIVLILVPVDVILEAIGRHSRDILAAK